MKIKQFVQGMNDDELFVAIGNWATSSFVHNELGCPIVSQPGNIWHIAYKADIPVGFSLLDGSHIKHVYAGIEADSIREQLLEKTIKSGESRLWTFAPNDDRLWQKFGFKFKKHARGKYGTWYRENVEK